MLRRPPRQVLLLAALPVSALSLSFLLAAQVQAQGDPNSPQRAANLARMKAEILNGGLGVYRAAPCMHDQGGGECLVGRSGEGFTFRFFGGKPGWQQEGLAPTVETEILVAPNGRSIERVIYNGPPRQTFNP
ncbi:MAG: hypothetical protein VKN83_06980 [Cyanobacteriota bacterium]|jgi:hypothetical protein|nr:hypothetical protein [Cyanobacteriota bacterium]